MRHRRPSPVWTAKRHGRAVRVNVAQERRAAAAAAVVAAAVVAVVVAGKRPHLETS